MRVTAAVAAHDKDINALAVSPNDALVATASQDRTTKVIASHPSPLPPLRGGGGACLWQMIDCWRQGPAILAESGGGAAGAAGVAPAGTLAGGHSARPQARRMGRCLLAGGPGAPPPPSRTASMPPAARLGRRVPPAAPTCSLPGDATALHWACSRACRTGSGAGAAGSGHGLWGRHSAGVERGRRGVPAHPGGPHRLRPPLRLPHRRHAGVLPHCRPFRARPSWHRSMCAPPPPQT